MEEILQAVSKEEYNEVATLILLDKLEQEDLEKLLYFLFIN
jgi:hypothetical protein